MREASTERMRQSAKLKPICRSTIYNLRETSYSSFLYVIFCKINCSFHKINFQSSTSFCFVDSYWPFSEGRNI